LFYILATCKGTSLVLSRYGDFRKTFHQNLVTYFGWHIFLKILFKKSIAIRIISRSCWIEIVYCGFEEVHSSWPSSKFLCVVGVCYSLSQFLCFCASLSLSPNFSLSSLDISITSAASKQASKASKQAGGWY
jgi:hypothetical protein